MTNETRELVERLWLATKHGDADHQQWLKDAYTAFFAGEPVPPPRGSGNKEKCIQSLSERNAVLEALVFESLYHLRLDERAKAYHERALTTLPTTPQEGKQS